MNIEQTGGSDRDVFGLIDDREGHASPRQLIVECARNPVHRVHGLAEGRGGLKLQIGMHVPRVEKIGRVGGPQGFQPHPGIGERNGPNIKRRGDHQEV